MLTIFKGSKSKALAVAIAAGRDYSGAKLVAEYQSAKREFTNLTAGEVVRVAFTAEETAKFAIGTYTMTLTLVDADGDQTDIGGTVARIRVTEDPDEVTEDVALVLSSSGSSTAALAGVAGLEDGFTDNDVKTKLNTIIKALGGTVAAIALALVLPFSASGADVRTAIKGEIPNTNRVVTAVNFDGLATETFVTNAVAGAGKVKSVNGQVGDVTIPTNFYSKAETDSKIIELAPAPGNYANVSNAAMKAVSPAAATNIAEAVIIDRPILLADTKTNLVYILKAEGGLGDGGFYFYAYTNDTSVVNK